jgi:hypothetical protein
MVRRPWFPPLAPDALSSVPRAPLPKAALSRSFLSLSLGHSMKCALIRFDVTSASRTASPPDGRPRLAYGFLPRPCAQRLPAASRIGAGGALADSSTRPLRAERESGRQDRLQLRRMPLTVFDIRGIPGNRRERIAAADGGPSCRLPALDPLDAIHRSCRGPAARSRRAVVCAARASAPRGFFMAKITNAGPHPGGGESSAD